MAEGINADASRPKLEYPYPEPPARGQTLEVAPGVRWIRMPLPYALNHINLWALDDGDGWALVDTGARTDEAALVWRELFAQAPDARGITRVFVTHMHPDHVGLAGWLTRKFGVRLWMTQLEYLYCRAMVADTGREAPDDALHFYRRAGWSEIAIENYRARFGNFGKHVHSLPDSFRRLCDGDWLQIGANRWQVIVGRGHSPEHRGLRYHLHQLGRRRRWPRRPPAAGDAARLDGRGRVVPVRRRRAGRGRRLRPLGHRARLARLRPDAGAGCRQLLVPRLPGRPGRAARRAWARRGRSTCWATAWAATW
jgi:glyoxylase-like metal-dependent hydrolase (beta-lactamase superfamily II)